MIKYIKKFIGEWSERLQYDGLTYEECCKYAGGGGKGGSSERPVTEEEKRLWDAQAVNLDAMTKIAEEQYNLSVEDRDYYERIFREGTDTEAKEALAKLQGTITGKEVDPTTIESVDIDSLLRDTLLTASPEFQEQANSVIQKSQELTEKYGAEVTGLSKSFADSIKSYTNTYADEMAKYKEATGTINQDVLSRETGAATAGISTAFEEARKQQSADLARRGLAGSGVEANVLSNMYQQEAMAKAQAGTQARGTALQQSEAIRQQQAGYDASMLQAGISGATQAYQGELGGIQNVYGVTTAQDYQNYQTSQAATLQGISALQQVAQAGQGIYAGSQNYLSGAASTSGNAAQIAGQSASNIASVNQQYAQMQQQSSDSAWAGIGSLTGQLGAAYFLKSDRRLKTNISFKEVKNGYNIYTWDWIDGVDGGYNEGVIAQEVLEIKPEAVCIDVESGYYKVNYSMLGV